MAAYRNAGEAYDALSILTEEYTTIQARIDELRTLSRALHALATSYGREDMAETPMFDALVKMGAAQLVERNRLYQRSSRLVEEMGRINGLIQNGAYDHE